MSQDKKKTEHKSDKTEDKHHSNPQNHAKNLQNHAKTQNHGKADAKVQIKGITVKKDDDFSEWYSQIVQKAELADIRYNVKGFVCYMPWAVKTIKKMYEKYEYALEKKGHLPLIMPSVIPESNFKLEGEHVEGFTPEVFWITETGNGNKLDERLALRPTSETAMYQMYSLWIHSYRDLPYKRYQSCQVWRCEGKMTRPFFRAREFHWIESHNVFANETDARAQVIEDMETTYEMLEGEFAIPIIFFQRPEWDKFPGAIHTYAADALMKSGKVIQLPSTHLLGDNFSKPFNVKYRDKDETEKYGHITCYGPAISRIYGAMVAILGDDKGLVLPWDLSPTHIVIVPIIFEKSKDQIIEKCKSLAKELGKHYIVQLDDRDYVSAGEKFNEWELKGVPIRIEIGPKDLENNSAKVVVRKDGRKEFVKLDVLNDYIKNIAHTYTEDLKKVNLTAFDTMITKAETLDDVKKAIDSGKIACTGFCSLEKESAKCAGVIEKDIGAFVRGKRVTGETHKFKRCVVCGNPSTVTVYVAKSY